jgi:hypothetical protein
LVLDPDSSLGPQIAVTIPPLLAIARQPPRRASCLLLLVAVTHGHVSFRAQYSSTKPDGRPAAPGRSIATLSRCTQLFRTANVRYVPYGRTMPNSDIRWDPPLADTEAEHLLGALDRRPLTGV